MTSIATESAQSAKSADTPLLDPDEQAAIRPPEKLIPSQWAERYRVLSRAQSNYSGPWRNDLAPYLTGLMDIPAKPGVTQANIMKAAQIGGSEALRGVIGYRADREPDPIGITLPNQTKGRQIVGNRIIPLFVETPRLQRLLTEKIHDRSKEHILLANGLRIFLMWSGSPASMASDPMCVVINDEVDKFERWSGVDASPVESTWVRMRTYEDRKRQYNISTPTSTAGEIFLLWDGSDVRLYFFVPCPECQKPQRLQFGNLKWRNYRGEDKQPLAPKKLAAKIKRMPGSVWYECEHCGKHISEKQKPEMIRNGFWSTDDLQVPDIDGLIYTNAADVPAFPPDTSLGMQISALYCLWVKWPAIAAQFITAGKDQQKLFNFYTQTLGEPYEVQVHRAPASVFEKKSELARLDEGLLPSWTAGVIITIDTQKDFFKCVVRAWGVTQRDDEEMVYLQSQRVWHGRLETFPQLDGLLARHWPFEKQEAHPYPAIPAGFAMIDSGGTQTEEDESRTAQVYRWGLRYVRAGGDRLRMIKGSPKAHGSQQIWPTKGHIALGPKGGPKRRIADVPLWMIRTHYWEDLLAAAILQGYPDADSRPDVWFLNKRNDEEYNAELGNRQKVVRTKRGKQELVWVAAVAGQPYDYRHCEVYQMAAAHAKLLPALMSLGKSGDLPSLDQFHTDKQKGVDAAAAAQAKTKPVDRSRKVRDKGKPSGFDVTGWK